MREKRFQSKQAKICVLIHSLTLVPGFLFYLRFAGEESPA